MPSLHDVVAPFYSLANRSGLLNRPFVQKLFIRSYYIYKELIEDPFTPLVRDRPELFTKGHILDVGANVGYTAVLFSSALSSGFKVFAFEPEPRNFVWLQEAVATRQLSGRITPVQAAVGDKEGTAELWLNPIHHADHRMVTPTFHGDAGLPQETKTVPLVTLDHYCQREIPGQLIAFIKIDVQGYEECVCRGMSEILAKNPAAHVGVEYYPKGMKSLGFRAAEVPDFFKVRGYHAYTLTRKSGLQSVSYEGIADVVGPEGYIDLLFSKSDKLDGTKPQ